MESRAEVGEVVVHQRDALGALLGDPLLRGRGLLGARAVDQEDVLELLVDRVIVTDGEVEIRYVFPTGPDGEREPFCRLRTDYLQGVGLAEPLRQVVPGDAGAQDVDHGLDEPPQPFDVALPDAGDRDQLGMKRRPHGVAQTISGHLRHS